MSIGTRLDGTHKEHESLIQLALQALHSLLPHHLLRLHLTLLPTRGLKDDIADDLE